MSSIHLCMMKLKGHSQIFFEYNYYNLYLVVWNNFCQFPDLYKRIRIDTIQIKRNQPELYESRLNKFIENTRNGVLYGEWNDNGRL